MAATSSHRRNRKRTVAYCGYQFCYIKHVIDMHADILGKSSASKCTKPDCELKNQFMQQVSAAGIPPAEYSNYHVMNYLHEDAQCREITHGVRCKNIVPHYRYKYQNYRCDTHDPWNKTHGAPSATTDKAAADSGCIGNNESIASNVSIASTASNAIKSVGAATSVQHHIPAAKPISATVVSYIRVPMFNKAWGDESSDEE